MEGRQSIVDKARQSGFTHLPQALAGTQRRLARPPSHRIEDTAPLDLPASRFIVEHAHEAHAERPLVIVTGGQLTTVANAYLLDPSIADKVVVSGVFGVRQQDYNAGLDSWAWKIVLSRFRVLAIPIGPPSHRGTVYQKPPRVPKNRIQSELPLDRPLFQWMYEKRHPNNELPAGHDWDGQAAIPLTRPSYITDITRWRAEGVDEDGNLILTEDSDGPIYQAQDADQAVATSEFWRVMHKVASTL